MTGLWLVSYLILWLIVVISALVVLALSREVEYLHKQIEALHLFFKSRENTNSSIDRPGYNSAEENSSE